MRASASNTKHAVGTSNPNSQDTTIPHDIVSTHISTWCLRSDNVDANTLPNKFWAFKALPNLTLSKRMLPSLSSIRSGDSSDSCDTDISDIHWPHPNAPNLVWTSCDSRLSNLCQLPQLPRRAPNCATGLGLSSRGAWQSEKTEKRNTCISRFWTNSIESLWICSACSVVWLSLDFSHFVQLAIWVPCDPGFCWEQITNNHYTFGAFAAYSATLDSLSPSNHGLVVFDLTCRFGHPGQNFNTSKWHGGEHRTIVSSQLAVTMFKHV